MRFITRLVTAVTLAVVTSSAFAITYIVPTDRDLVKRAEAIVVATALDSHSELRDGGRLVTVATLQVERVLKGAVGEKVELVELGGAIGNRVTMIPGSPRYEDGKRYLVFLRTNSRGEWMTYGFALGKFEFISDRQNRDLVTRGDSDERIFGLDEADGSLHVEHLRRAPEFLSFVESRVASEAPAREDYFVDQSDVIVTPLPELRPRASAFVPHTESTRPDYMLDCGGGVPCRWQSPSAAFVHCCSAQTGGTGLDGPSGSSSAMAAWNAAGAGVSYSLTGQDLSATGGLSHSDGKNGILFNDPDNLIGNSGAVAVGGISNASGIYGTCSPTPCPPDLGDGFTYFKTIEVDVVTGKNLPSFIGQSLYMQLLTHELGHTLGFHHADGTSSSSSPPPSCQAPSPCAAIGQAIMASVLPSGNSIGSLGPWDLDAVNTVYGSGPVCNAPSISTQPASQSISLGSQATLTVAATGTTPFTYQWFVGTSGTTTTPVGTNSTTFNPSPSTTTSYWVRVSNSCNGVQFANSNTAVVTVTCTAPSAPAPAAVPSSITSGQSSTITETPTGSGPFTYQWYSGNSGVTTSPIGGSTSNNSITVNPTVTTSYWVRVTGQCAPTADSPAATVTVTPCVPPSAATPVPSPSSITSGQSSFISEGATGSGPLTYQWYLGNSPSTASPIGGPTGNSFISVSPTTTTSYWVRVTGQCGSPSDSQETTVTVTCAPIASGPFASPQTINNGQSSQLSINTAGNGPFTIQWYQGNSGDTSSMINGATGTSTVVSPTVNTSYWVRVSSSCGTQDSNSVVIVVNGSPCTAASITTPPASSTIASGSPVTLTVVSAGTAPLTYQWFTGDKGDTSNPISGATSASLIRSPTVTTKYWVRVTGCNNSTADSNTATITVSTCTPPSITTQPANVSAPIGTAATFKVVATGTALHYQWYEGNKGNTTKTVGTDSSTFVTDAVDFNNVYWVRLTGQCGTADSDAATVTAIAPPRGRAVRH